ncbi:MAG: histidinol-phosphate transaminase [Acidimicrobiia bacterium]|nr:MAG: histidinol-phosphate transaminase [Acidimicrobiia bacterium]
MPTYRSDLEAIPQYRPGRPIEEVTRELGIESLDKLASNECPEKPFPEVIEAIVGAASDVNRYPDSATYELTRAIATHQGVTPDNIWVGSGSSEVLRCSALAVGGPGTSAVFADPSFVMYRIATMVAGATPIAIPLTDAFDHDLDEMMAAIRDDTTIVYLCNPNNPTGGHLSGSDVARFIDAVPHRVLVVVDEAYAEYVTADDYTSFVDEALVRPNVLVTRTFSKIYGLAGLRVGYGVGSVELISNLRRTQAPFSVTSASQSAALEALKHQNRVAERRGSNAVERAALVASLRDVGFSPAPTQANFVYFVPDMPAAEVGDGLLHRGEIVRVLGDGIRVTVGTPEENGRFIAALRDVMIS